MKLNSLMKKAKNKFNKFCKDKIDSYIRDKAYKNVVNEGIKKNIDITK